MFNRDNEMNDYLITCNRVNRFINITIDINFIHQPPREQMQLNQNKESRITRSYRVKPELNERFTKSADKHAHVKSKIIERAIERYVLAHE